MVRTESSAASGRCRCDRHPLRRLRPAIHRKRMEPADLRGLRGSRISRPVEGRVAGLHEAGQGMASSAARGCRQKAPQTLTVALQTHSIPSHDWIDSGRQNAFHAVAGWTSAKKEDPQVLAGHKIRPSRPETIAAPQAKSPPPLRRGPSLYCASLSQPMA